MSTTLYPGIAFSPQALLTDNIGASDTIIPVSDVSCFPEGPNLATIGTDETGETIFYAAKTANALSGCQRGVEGEARTWTAGESIGRNFTAKDHNDLINFLGQKQDKLNGKSGQVVGFDAKGQAVPQDPPVPPNVVTAPGGGEIEMEESLGEGPHTFEFTPEEDGSAVQASQVGYESTESGLEAETVQAALDQLSTIKADVGRVSNGNLLDNWYFPDPINQRGQTEYTGSGYTIDRWRSTNENLSTIILSDGIQLLTPANASGSGYFRHYFENPLPPGIYTYSALVRGTGSGFMNVTDEPAGSFFGPNAVIANPGEAWTLTTGTFLSTDTTKIRIAYFRCNAGSSFDIKAAKLELGPVQTLAHQDADGNWVLNDPPPNKALELAKCQRYQVDTNTEQSPFALTAVSTNMLFGSIVFATSMRIKPAVNGLTLRKIKDGQLTQVTGFALQGTTDGIFAITKIAPSTLIAGEMYQIMASFDANL